MSTVAQSIAESVSRADSIPLDQIDVANPELWISKTFWDYFAWRRREDPVHYCANSMFGAYWSVTSFKDIPYVDTHPEIFCSESKLGGIAILENNRAVSLPMFIAMDPPKHDQQR